MQPPGTAFLLKLFLDVFFFLIISNVFAFCMGLLAWEVPRATPSSRPLGEWASAQKHYALSVNFLLFLLLFGKKSVFLRVADGQE